MRAWVCGCMGVWVYDCMDGCIVALGVEHAHTHRVEVDATSTLVGKTFGLDPLHVCHDLRHVLQGLGEDAMVVRVCICTCR